MSLETCYLFHFEDLNETFYASEFFKTGPQLRVFFTKGLPHIEVCTVQGITVVYRSERLPYVHLVTNIQRH